MKIVGTIRVDPPEKMLKNHGLDPGGAVQKFHTQNAIRRIQKYMPFRTGSTIRLMVAQSPINEPFIHIDEPQARYLYYGKVMVGKAPKTPTDRDLQYDPTKNPQAGPYWDRRLMANEKDAMQQDLQSYVDGRQV